MKTAICLTPDRNFFGPALCTASCIRDCGLRGDADILLICEERDVWEGFDPANSPARLMLVDFADLIGEVPMAPGNSTATYRRLVLDRVLPSYYSRIIPVDSDMHIAREGLAPLIGLDLGGFGIAAAIDMIFLMDFGGHLALEFQAYRARLGLPADCFYFNNGLTVIDRAFWRNENLGIRTLQFIRENRGSCDFLDQSALNALLKGGFAPLSPRYNFMGDFFLLDLEKEIAPAVYHFVNRPKPWQAGFTGEDRFAALYRDWFRDTPWPDFPSATLADAKAPPVNRNFRKNLMTFLRAQRFADGWTMP